MIRMKNHFGNIAAMTGASLMEIQVRVTPVSGSTVNNLFKKYFEGCNILYFNT